MWDTTRILRKRSVFKRKRGTEIRALRCLMRQLGIGIIGVKRYLTLKEKGEDM